MVDVLSSTASIYLCDRVRPSHSVSNNLTCRQIWHIKWKNGDERPRPRVGRDIQMRGIGKKRHRCPKSSNNSDNKGDSEDDGTTGSDVSGVREIQNTADVSEAQKAENVHETALEGGNDSECG
ncbi:hypothetical protein PInf_022054 [Phytophthora infestans]|nr:hypothetical protein PInf_022054 [Phytophthora infestans]